MRAASRDLARARARRELWATGDIQAPPPGMREERGRKEGRRISRAADRRNVHGGGRRKSGSGRNADERAAIRIGVGREREVAQTAETLPLD